MKLTVLRTLPLASRIVKSDRLRQLHLSPIIAQAKKGDEPQVPATSSGQHGLRRRTMAGPRSPFSLLRDLEEEIDSLMRGGGLGMSLEPAGMPRMGSLACDIEDKGNAYAIHADVPGMHQDDIKIEVNPEGVLTISGERKQETKSEEGDMVRIERSFGSFSRSFKLPEHTDHDRIDATIHNGVLQLTVPKVQKEVPQSKTIDVKVKEN